MEHDLELHKLRTSLVRIAQALNMPLEDFPTAVRPKSWGWDHLVEVMKNPRGWNALAARIVGRVEEGKHDHANMVSELTSLVERWKMEK